MEAAYRIDRLAEEGHRLIGVARRDLGAAVPSCPDWTTGDLLDHVRRVWTSIAAHAEQLPDEPLPWSSLPDLDADDALARLVHVLRAVDPGAPVWTWGADHTAAFYIRRAHQETIIHRVDAELALGDRTPIPADDALDGLDELLTVVLPARVDEFPDRTLHLHQTDGDGEFMLESVDGALVVRREHAKGDAAVRGTGEELLSLMWGRRGLEGLEVFGDADIVTEWARLSP